MVFASQSTLDYVDLPYLSPLVSLIFLIIVVAIWAFSRFENRDRSVLLKAPVIGAYSGSWLSILKAKIYWPRDGVSMLYKAYEEV